MYSGVGLEEGLHYVEGRFNRLYHEFPPTEWKWVVCYSGGKDSTALLLSLMELAEGKGFTFTILHEFTTVDIPAVENHVELVLKRFEKRGVEVRVLKPFKGFFDVMLEKGYGFPTWYRRWCCRVFKYGPAKTWVKSLGRKTLSLLAIRGDEGRRVHGFVRVGHDHSTALPLIDVTEMWVWEFLERTCPWFEELKRLYPNGSSRLGCWTCTVVSEDPALKALDPQLYEIKTRLVQARCLNLRAFIRLLDRYSKIRPDAFKGYNPSNLINVKEPSCKGRYCSTCRVKVWRYKGLCSSD